jgi:hypothetical protein
MKNLLPPVSACAVLMLCAPAQAGSAHDDLAQAVKVGEQAIPMPHGKERLAVISQADERLQKVFDDANFDKSSCTDAAANMAQLYQDEDKTKIS